MSPKNPDTSTAGRELVVTRLIDAPPQLVYQAWTSPEHVVQWWGPRGFRNTNIEMSVKPGGVWRFVMHAADGRDYPNRIAFSDVVPGERLAYEHGSDMADDPDRFSVTVTFVAEGQKTRLTMRSVFKSVAALEAVKKFGAESGGLEHAERLAEHVTTFADSAFTVQRVFIAPRDLVWKAHTEADRLAQWWGPAGFKVHVAKLDLRPGGLFHYSMQAPNGDAMWGKFVYRDVVPQERLVFVNSFSDAAGGMSRHPMAPTWPEEVLNTLTLMEQGGKTTLTLRGHPIHASDSERQTFDGGKSSMNQGFKGTFDQLEAYLTKAKTNA